MGMAIRVATLTAPDGRSLVFSNIEDNSGDYQAWLTDVAGFFGGVGVSDQGSQRKLGHGFFAVPSLRTGRSITLSGMLTFEDESLRCMADRFLSGQLWDGGFGTLEVQVDDLTLSCKVQLDGEIKHSYNGELAIDVQIPLHAPDPFLYAPERLYQVFHAGTGQGLVFPLFTTQSMPVGSELLNFTQADLVSAKTAETYKDKPVYALTSTRSFAAAPVVGGKTYGINIAHKASKPGSGIALLANIQSSKGLPRIGRYFGGDSAAVFENGLEWKADVAALEVPPGYDSVQLSVFVNHANYPVQDATHYFTFSLKEGTPVLDWGRGTPFSGAFANQGNATAWPKVVVHGSFPAGFRIVEGARVVEFPSTVYPTSPVEIDMRAGEVMVNGSDHTYKLSRRDWIDIPAQSSILPRIEALSNLQSEGWADFLVRDTYM